MSTPYANGSQALPHKRDYGEVRRGWRLILGAMLGIGLGIMALPYSTSGLFIGALQEEFGWTRTQISLGPTILLALVALLAPLVGWLADRISPLVIIGFSMAAVAAGFFLLSRMGPSIHDYYLIIFGMALLGAGASTVVFARLICAHFVEQRGLALGLVMAGNGITTILSPVLVSSIIVETGWRTAYVALAIVILLGTVLMLVLLARGGGRASAREDARPLEGATFEQAVSRWHFWTMGAAFFLGTFATTGMVVHLIPFLTDGGISVTKAGAIASLIGLGLIIGRLLTGWLMDRVPAYRVGVAMMVVSGAGLMALASGNSALLPLGALSIGLCIGAELDLIGYLTGQYFGMKAYGRIYGVLYMLCAAGTALSPLFYGYILDQSQSYQSGLISGAIMLAASAGLLALMGAVRRQT